MNAGPSCRADWLEGGLFLYFDPQSEPNLRYGDVPQLEVSQLWGAQTKP